MFSPKKEFFKSCALGLLRLAAAALPATFLVLCVMDLPDVSPLPRRLICFAIIMWTLGGPLVGAIFRIPAEDEEDPRTTIFWAIPCTIYLGSCAYDLFVSVVPSFLEVGPINLFTPKILVKLLDDQLDDYHTALFITLVLKVVLVIAFFVGVAVATFSHSSARVRTKKPKTKSDDTKPKDQPPKYETVINVDK